ncbi:MAG: hydrogenase formation protein HypD [Clostridia bacterium]|nr:hydrogenase formation protein HypD [Clostridia bacterium]
MDREVERLAGEIRACTQGLPPFSIMEVCGTHTQNIARFGLRQLLPAQMRLLSGPGCPVCVTEDDILRKAICLAGKENITVVSFGDMLRVPCVMDASYRRESLYHLRGLGKDVRIGTSPMDILRMAKAEPDREFVWLGVGFETTTPHTAALLLALEREGIPNVSVLCAHKTMPNAIRAVLRGKPDIQGLLCPGHVSVITGSEAFSFIPREYAVSAAVSGFTASDILKACLSLVRMIRDKKPCLVNDYPAAVTRDGNRTAQAITEQVFEVSDAMWRGLGPIPSSGLRIREAYRRFDAEWKYGLADSEESFRVPGCLCASILRGEASPAACPHFGKTCVPENPVGPCMVSDEGVCHTAYLYGG